MLMGYSLSIDQFKDYKDGDTKAPSLIPDSLLESILGLKAYRSILEKNEGQNSSAFVSQLFKDLEIALNVEGEENIPEKGRTVFVSNHPSGLAEIIVLEAIFKVRDDIGLVCNDFIPVLFPGIKDMAIPLTDEADGYTAIKRSLEALEEEKGVIIFPAGTIAHKHKGVIEEQRWHKGAIIMAKQSHSPIVPIRTDAEASKLFYFLRNFPNIGNSLSTMLFIRELLKQRGKTITVQVKPQVYQDELTRKGGTKSKIKKLREITLA